MLSLLWSCSSRPERTGTEALFTLLDPAVSGVDFQNRLEYTEEYNTYTYRNFYNGAGAGLGDFNRDGLTDIYFCGNQVDNRLYINRGDFRFEDVTGQAGVGCPGVWSTGVSIADVNGDGWPDIYVCKSGIPGTGNRHNELFINNGDLTFSEKAAEYGIAVLGLSTHASFFDYDRDGDLDCYLLNNSFQSVTRFDLLPGQREVYDTLGGNRLYRNDGARFTDVTRESGIYGSKIGFGLGVSVADINRDGWPDLYVSNDFFERDYLYLNNRDGTFTECLEEQLPEISLGAMGADIADINNDAWPEIFVTEMTAEGDSRLKTKVLFESWEAYRFKEENGYHRQFARNVLQLNNRNGTFSEIGRFSGVSQTDWSWGALILDLDNDGWKDIFVANGIFKDLLDRDYLDLYSDPALMRSMIRSEEEAIMNMIDAIPSVRIPNYAFHNNRDLTFTNRSKEWGLSIPSHSNGAAYGDLDNDGDLDLVVNNVNMPSFLFRNNSETMTASNYLVVALKGKGMNSSAIGSAVTIWYGNGQTASHEQVPMRGFKSSMDHRVHFGLGGISRLDSMQVRWPDGVCTMVYDLPANRIIELEQPDAGNCADRLPDAPRREWFCRMEEPEGLHHTHVENDFTDFTREGLLFYMRSNEGPKMAVADVNGDGLEDIYICGPRDQPGALYMQLPGPRFVKTGESLFMADRLSEETACAFFDADGDGDPDLYVACGGNEFPSSSSALADRLYINNGKGKFTRSPGLPAETRYVSTSCVEPADFDGDGDLDLFVGSRHIPFNYGVPASGYLLENDGKGNFRDVSGEKAPALSGIGMITGMTWADVENDSDMDMVIAGEWMPVSVLIQEEGQFTDRTDQLGLSLTAGWWNTVEACDLEGDGDTDLVLGNHGLNSFFKASEQKPVTMYVNDFDLNGRVEQIICTYNGDTSFPVVMKDDLVRQIPYLENSYARFSDYRGQTITDIFSPEVVERSLVKQVYYMESCVLINEGGSFSIHALPAQAQFFPVYAVLPGDFDGDGFCDLLLGGNQFRARPQTGIHAAGYGLVLKGKGTGEWETVDMSGSGMVIPGEVRDFNKLEVNGDRVIVVARNNEKLEFYKLCGQ